MTINVFLDMDGVVVNLDKKIQEVFGTEYKNVSPNVLWNTLGDIPDLFLNLEPMPNYLTLFNYLKQLESNGLIHLEILTSLPYSTKKLVTSKQDKIAWVREHLDKNIVVNTVVGGAKKSRFVKQPSDILIDDLERNITAWENAGGTGILHKSIAYTIAGLGKYVGD
jgi:5'(3')-deoxyribonucleotidase